MRRSAPSGAKKKNVSPHATPGAPFASLAVTAATPGIAAINSMISFSVIAARNGIGR